MGAYTPERAEQQWLRLREAFLQLQTEAGRRYGQRIRRSDVEARLVSMETSYRSTFVKKVAQCRRRQERLHVSANKTKERDPQLALLRRLQRLLRAGDRKNSSDERQQRRVATHRRKEESNRSKKRRWDGKESFDDFKRRMRTWTSS